MVWQSWEALRESALLGMMGETMGEQVGSGATGVLGADMVRPIKEVRLCAQAGYVP